MSQQAEINLDLHDKQLKCLFSTATEILYGGAAGGGKSHLMRCAAIIWCVAIAGLQVYLFRRIKDDLVKNHIEGPKGFRNLLAVWVDAGLAEITDKEIRFWNGSKIFLCHCKDEKHRFKYQGSEMHVLLIDELTHFTETIYRYLRGRVRKVGLPPLPKEYKGMFPRIVCGSNPGGIGHLFVKTTFVDSALEGEIHRASKKEGGMLRQYIRALLDDNPSLLEDDPEYEDRLEGLGSEALVKAMRYADWNIIEGAFFDCWSVKLIIKPFEVPKKWIKFVSFDWGSAKPFSVGWWTVSEGDILPDGRQYPKGALIRYREWYGQKEGAKADTGCKLTSRQVAKGIIDRQQPGEEIDYHVADPAIFANHDGPSIAEKMLDEEEELTFFQADNSRVPGWDQVSDRMKGEDQRPMIYFFETCRDSIRTIPALQHDENRPEDLNTSMEDHAADETRYAAMSRPYTRPLSEKRKDKEDRWDKAFDKEESGNDTSWKTA